MLLKFNERVAAVMKLVVLTEEKEEINLIY